MLQKLVFFVDARIAIKKPLFVLFVLYLEKMKRRKKAALNKKDGHGTLQKR
jgi:hypothetical protein